MLFIMGVVAFLMLGFGMGGGGRMRHLEPALKVDDEEVSYEQYTRRYNDLVNQMRQQLGPNFDRFRDKLNLQQQAIDSIIRDILLKRVTDSLGLSVSTNQVEREILASPVFKDGYNDELFKRYLRALNMDSLKFENQMKTQMVQQQLQQTLADLSVPSEKELRAVFVAENRTSEFRYVTLKSADFAAKVDVQDETKIQKYFDENSESFRAPKSIRYSYVDFSPDKFLSAVEVTDEDVAEAYRQRQTEFFEPKKLHIRQILFRLDPDKKNRPGEKDPLESLMSGEDPGLQDAEKTKEARKTSANAALKRLDEGEDFIKVANEVSADKSSGATVIDRGWVTSDSLEPNLRQAAADLDIGAHSKVIETKKGLFIIFVEDIKERREKPLAEVKDKIIQDLRKADAPDYARVEADNFLEEWEKQNSMSLKDFAASKNLAARETEKLLKDDENPAGAPRGLTKKLISSSEGSRTTVDIKDTSFVAEILEVKESHVPPFEAVKDKAKEAYIKAQSKVLAKDEAGAILKEISPATDGQRKTLEQVAAARSLEAKLTKPLKRRDAFGEPFTAEGSQQAAFTLSAEKPVPSAVFEDKETYYVLELVKVTLPDEKEFPEKQKELLSQEWQRAGTRMMSVLVDTLKAKSNIWIDPRFKETKPEEFSSDEPIPVDY